MGGVRLSFSFEGEQQVDRLLERFQLGAQDASPAFDAIGDRVATLEQKQFRSEGRAGGHGWAQLSPDYAAWKARHFPGTRILERTGAMRDSITRRPFGIDVVGRDFGLFGTGVSYAPYHQAGGPNLPQRRLVDVPESERREWVKVLQQWLVTGRV